MKRYLIIVMFLMLVIGFAVGNITGHKETYSILIDLTPNTEEKINFVEVFFPNVPTGISPLGGDEVFALSFVVEQMQLGSQAYGGRNLIAEAKSIHYHNRILDMRYNYFVFNENYNITLVIRDGLLINGIVERELI